MLPSSAWLVPYPGLGWALSAVCLQERYRLDCNLAVQLLKCNKSHFRNHKLADVSPACWPCPAASGLCLASSDTPFHWSFPLPPAEVLVLLRAVAGVWLALSSLRRQCGKKGWRTELSSALS